MIENQFARNALRWSVGMFLAFAPQFTIGQEPQLGPKVLAELKRLEVAANQAEETDDYQEALRLRREMLGLRSESQGKEHWETINESYVCKRLEKTILLTPEQQADWRKVYRASVVLNNMLSQRDKSVFEYEPSYKLVVRKCQSVLGEEHPHTALCLTSLGILRLMQGSYAEAESLLAKSLEIRLTCLGSGHPLTATAYANLATALQKNGKYSAARPLFQRALEIHIEIHGPENLQVAADYNGLALNSNAQGRYLEAYEQILKAHQIMSTLMDDKANGIAQTYNNVGLVLNAQGEFEAAQPYYEKGLQYCIENFGEHPFTALCYSNVGYNLYCLDRLEEAEAVLQKSLELRLSLLGENHPETATSYNNLAGVFDKRSDPEKAGELYQKAFKIRKRYYGLIHPETLSSFINLAYNLDDRGETEASLKMMRASVPSYEGVRYNNATRGFTRALYAKLKSPHHFIATLEAQAGNAIAAWEAAEQGLAQGLGDELARRQGQLGTTEERERMQSLQLQYAQARSAVRRSSSSAEQDQATLDQLLSHRAKVEEAISELTIKINRRARAELSDVQAAIEKDAALVFWVDAREQHWGCVVRATGPPAWVSLPGSGAEGEWTDSDKKLPRRLRNLVADEQASTSAIDEAIAQLRRQRLAPLESHLSGVRQLYVVHANQMAGVPVELLVEGRVVSYVPSGTLLAFFAKDQPDRNEEISLLAIGDPQFGSADENVEQPWPSLPGSRVEVENIEKLVGGSPAILLGAEASEQELDRLRQDNRLANYRFIHFATHGVASTIRTMDSSLILSHDASAASIIPRPDQPHLNGKISAQEVLDYWDLDAELVTLSACETALGRSGGGDGMLGFSQAFLAAGSRAVCVSLWKVDDTATTLLMTRFYENLLGARDDSDEPMTKADALAEAKNWLRTLSSDDAKEISTKFFNDENRGQIRKVRAQSKADLDEEQPFADPRYWAAFILVGDPK